MEEGDMEVHVHKGIETHTTVEVFIWKWTYLYGMGNSTS